jgi:tetratricopeptide (TPR) repeat protein
MGCGRQIGIAMSRRVFDAWVAAILAGIFVLAPPVRAQSKSPEASTGSTSQAPKSELQSVYGGAVVDGGRAFEVDPTASVADKRRTLQRRAALYEETKEFAKAEEDWALAIKLGPPVAALHGDRGYFYIRIGRYAEALDDFNLGMQLEPANPRYRYAAGRAQGMLSNYTAAADLYGEAIKLDPRDPTFYLARAEAFIHLAQPRRARADYDQALKINLPRPIDRYFAVMGRGFAALKLADYPSAIEDFDKALEFDPRAVTVLLWRGYAREKGGRVDLALDDYERASSVDPGNRTAQANLQRLRSH